MAVVIQHSHDFMSYTQWAAQNMFWDGPGNPNTGGMTAPNGTVAFRVYAASCHKVFVGSSVIWGAFRFYLGEDHNYSAPTQLVLGDTTKPHIGFWVGGGVVGARLFHAGRCSDAAWASNYWISGQGGSQTLGAELGTPTITFGSQEWHHVAFEVKVDDTVGYVKTWIDGVADLNVTGVDTQNGTGTSVTAVLLSEIWNQIYFDDMVFGNDSDINTASAGDVRVDCMKPDANGTNRANGGTGEMTRSTGADDYTLLDEAEANTTDYVYADAANERCSVNLAALTNVGGTILAVQATSYAAKNDAGLCKYKMYLLIGGTRYYSDEYVPLWGSWKFFRYLWNRNPATNAAWDETAFNSAQVGVERTA